MLAPLAGISDLPFRLINRGLGCEFAFTEMISAQALAFQGKNTIKLLATVPEDRPLAVQLLGDEPEAMLRSLDILRPYDIALIDLNAACPVRKVTAKGEGASLMKEPGKLKDLLSALVRNAFVPVTVKIRAGWDEESVNARDIALHAQDAGVSAITVHGRTRVQGYNGGVDYDVIRRVKEAVQVPVIGSGDALSPHLVKRMFDETGCDGVAIARGALGNPWIFRQTGEFLRAGAISQPPLEERMAVMVKHLNLCADHYGEQKGTVIFRKLYAWYIRGVPGMRRLKERGFHASTREEMMELINELRKSGNAPRSAAPSP